MKTYKPTKGLTEAERLNEFMKKNYPQFYRKPRGKHDPWSEKATSNQQFKRKWGFK